MKRKRARVHDWRDAVRRRGSRRTAKSRSSVTTTDDSRQPPTFGARPAMHPNSIAVYARMCTRACVYGRCLDLLFEQNADRNGDLDNNRISFPWVRDFRDFELLFHFTVTIPFRLYQSQCRLSIICQFYSDSATSDSPRTNTKSRSLSTFYIIDLKAALCG